MQVNLVLVCGNEKKIILRPSFDLSPKEKFYFDIESTESLTEKQ